MEHTLYDTRKLALQCWDHREETERERCLARPVADALIASGLCRAVLPKDLHGQGLDPMDWMTRLETLAGAEASASWIVWNNALFAFLTRTMEPSLRASVFQDPQWMYAQSTRPEGRAVPDGEGYRVSGHWTLVSGCELAEWLLVLCEIEGGEQGFALLRRGQFEIQDTWHVGGMRGTGSHDIDVPELVLPAEYLVLPGGEPTVEAPWAVLPIIALMGAGFAAQTLGIAGALVEATLSRQDERFALPVAMHETAITACRSHLHHCVEKVWRRAEGGKPADPNEVGAIYGAAAWANQAASRATDELYEAVGTRAIYSSAPYERACRDLRVMLQHVVAFSFWAKDAGRVRLGLAPEQPLYAL